MEEPKRLPFHLRVTGTKGAYFVEVVSTDERVRSAQEPLKVPAGALARILANSGAVQLRGEDVAEVLDGVRGTILSDLSIDQAERDAAGIPRRGSVRLTAEEFSRSLTDAVFTATVMTSFVAAETSAQERVALCVQVVPPELALLPWELLRVPTSQVARYFAKDSVYSFSRFTVMPTREVTALNSKPGVLALAFADAQRPLDFTKEKKALDDAHAAGRIELTWLKAEEASYQTLHQELRRGGYQFFHFAGHGGFDPKGVNGTIELCDGTVSAENLVALFSGSGVQFVFLNSCNGATSAPWNAFAGTAHHLLDAGVAVVVAMQHAIPDSAAGTFAKEFYERIAGGATIADAVTSARIAMSGPGARPYVWSTPVLYLNARDGRLVSEKRAPWKVLALIAFVLIAAVSGVVAYKKLREDEVRPQQPGNSVVVEPPPGVPQTGRTEAPEAGGVTQVPEAVGDSGVSTTGRHPAVPTGRDRVGTNRPYEGRFRVDFDSTPPGARVRLDDLRSAPIGVTPLRNRAVPVGAHSLFFDLPGYVPASRDINVTREGERFVVSLQQAGSINVSANVRSAAITIDGQWRGFTPSRINDLAPGQHVVEVQLEGFQPFTQTVSVQGGQSSEVSATLRRPEGTVRVIVVASDGRPLRDVVVLLDGVQMTGNPPASDQVVAGTHELRVIAPGHDSVSQTIAVAPNETRTVEVTL